MKREITRIIKRIIETNLCTLMLLFLWIFVAFADEDNISVSVNEVSDNSISHDSISTNSTSKNSMSENSLSDKEILDDTISANDLDDTFGENAILSVSDNMIYAEGELGSPISSSVSCGDNAYYDLYDTDNDGIGDYIEISGSGNINDAFFSNNLSIKKVVISEGITGIGAYEFDGCVNLSYIRIPSTVTHIGSGFDSNPKTFINCPLLKTVGPIGGGYNIEFGWTHTIPKFAFANTTSIEKVIIPEGIEFINSGAFKGCSNLQKLILPKSLENQADGSAVVSFDAYDNCPLLRTAGPIGGDYNIEYAFDHVLPYGVFAAESIQEVAILPSIITIDANCFEGSSIETITIPSSVTKIGAYAFYMCPNLKSITIPSGVKTIGVGICKDCNTLEKAEIEYGLREIPEDTFVGCSSLRELYIPSSVTEIFSWTGFYNGSSTPVTRLAIEGSSDLRIIGYPGTAAERYIQEWGAYLSADFEINPTPERIPNPREIIKIAFVSPGCAVAVGKKVSNPLNVSGAIYKSSNTKIATISSSGVIKGKKIGKVTITAIYNGKKYTTKVVVCKKPVLNGPNIVKVGKKIKLKIKGGAGTTIWKSQNPIIAQVLPNGKVIGISKGKTKIYATRAGVTMKKKITVK